MERHDNGESMRLMVDFFNTGHLSDVASVVSADYVDHQGVGGGELFGADGFASVVQLSRQRHPESKVEIDELHNAGQVVVAKLKWSEPTSRTGDYATYRRTIEIVRFAGGLAVEHWGTQLV